MPTVTVPNTFTPSTTISSSQVNANFTAVANGIIASLGLAGADIMTGQFKASNGTAAAPAMTFGSDLDTGIYRRGANELGFASAGVLAGYFDSAQKLWLEDNLDLAGDADIGGDAIIAGDIVLTGTMEIGHASDTTVSRLSAGDIAVEGNRVFRAGGTDVPIADGGTGASTAAAAFTALKQNASDTDTGVLEIATVAEMKTGTSTTLAVVPGRQRHHPAHPKAWGTVTGGGTPSLAASDNITSITDTDVGRLGITIATDFSSVNYACVASSTGSTNAGQADRMVTVREGTQAAGTIEIQCVDTGEDLTDPAGWHFVMLGEQA